LFPQHAQSRDGEAQLEPAPLASLLPRLRGWRESLAPPAGGRVAGGAGIGSRGPGETKIELDRRRIRTRMSKLRREIAAMAPSRETKRKNRARHHVPSVAIVGYTNAGKSSLLNLLTDAEVMVQNALFATLDPTVRQAQTADGLTFTYTDTVGFVRNLPHQLVEAFRSTLEEAAGSDLLLHVVDASHPDPHGQIQAVREVLKDVEIADEAVITGLRAEYPEAQFVSAATQDGIDDLIEAIEGRLPAPDIDITVLIPYERGDLVSKIYALGTVEHEEHNSEGTSLQAKV